MREIEILSAISISVVFDISPSKSKQLINCCCSESQNINVSRLYSTVSRIYSLNTDWLFRFYKFGRGKFSPMEIKYINTINLWKIFLIMQFSPYRNSFCFALETDRPGKEQSQKQSPTVQRDYCSRRPLDEHL